MLGRVRISLLNTFSSQNSTSKTLTPPGSEANMASTAPSSLLALPAELITHILSFLPPPHLAQISRSCRVIRRLADSELFWSRFVQQELAPEAKINPPSPCQSWKELYASHFPYWFLPKHRIWIADRALGGGGVVMGAVIVVRYDPRRGCIEGYRLVARHGQHEIYTWEYDHDVIIHSFSPEVSLHFEDPIIKLDLRPPKYEDRVRGETEMQCSPGNAIKSTMSLCRPIAPELQAPSMQLWPPRKIPAKQRVRSDSGNAFRGEGHRPKVWEEASDCAFRLRRGIDFQRRTPGIPSIRMGESITTVSTLLPESYTPTPAKPYQGIWVGDYSGHGCEFLLIMQKRVSKNAPRIAPSSWRADEFEVQERSHGVELDDVFQSNPRSDEPAETSPSPPPASLRQHDAGNDAQSERGAVVYNRLEAIKLTGDPNVPRGQYTWVAEDIGSDGLIRIANEDPFKGARVVKSFGHTAARGFRNGSSLIDSTLI